MNLTAPAALAVALILIGASPYTPLPPLKIRFPSAAALAGVMLIESAPTAAIPTTIILECFILLLLFLLFAT
jgi:hypothetical protein